MKRPLTVMGVFLVLIQVSANRGDARSAQRSTEPQSVTAAARISFRRDVAPVLATSCTTASCHGGGSRPPVLDAHADAARMRAALVGVASDQRPDRHYVEPGVPQNSYLVQKIEGRLIDGECADHDCGVPMPRDNPSLSADARAMIRTWIAQGAQDN
jgi:hypothetical protein